MGFAKLGERNMDRVMEEAVRLGLMSAQAQSEEATQFLGMIQRSVELLPQNYGVAKTCKELVRIVIEETNQDNCSILLWDPEKKKLVLEAAYGLEDLLGTRSPFSYHRDLAFERGEGIAGRAFGEQNPFFVDGHTQGSIPPKVNATVQPMSLACLPLLDVGVLCISSLRPYRFTVRLKRNWEHLSKIMAYLIVGASLMEPSTPETIQPPSREGNGRTKPRAPLTTSPAQLSDQALDRAPQGICILDIQGNILRINQTIERIQGGIGADLLGHSPGVLFRDPRVFHRLFDEVKRYGQREMNDVSLISSRGALYQADVYLAGLTQDGQVAAYLMVINDITQKKAFAEKFVQTEKLAALGTMAGGVAHDFNNLLMAILGNIQLILPNVGDKEIRQRLQNIEKAVHDGAHTVRRLQKLTEKDRDPVSAAVPSDLREVVSDVIELTRPRWKNAMEKHGHSIAFRMEIEPDCLVAIHPSDLREILTNLIFNAIEAMPEGGTIIFRSRATAGEIILEIADTGVGMGEEIQGKIFDPFFTTKGIGNSGLGLSVSWSLVNRAGGEISVRSKPGKGTVFSIQLPKAQASRKKVDSERNGEAKRTCRLLVVEDDPQILGILRDMLRLKGHKVVATDNSEAALNLIAEENFDLVLTDLGMPVVSGWDIAKQVKAKNPEVPVVMITGWGAQYEEEDLTQRGVDRLLSKPLSWDTLLHSIEQLLWR